MKDAIKNIIIGVLVTAITSAGYAVVQVNILEERVDSLKSLVVEIRTDVKELTSRNSCK